MFTAVCAVTVLSGHKHNCCDADFKAKGLLWVQRHNQILLSSGHVFIGSEFISPVMAELAPCLIYSQIAAVGAGMRKTHSLLPHHRTAGWHLAGTEAHMDHEPRCWFGS